MSDANKNPADRLKAIRDRVTTKAAPAKPARTAGQSVIAKLFGGKAPYGTSGPLGDDAGVSVQKAMALAGGAIDRDQAKPLADLSDRLKAVYGPFFPLSNTTRSVLVPTSAAYLPTHAENGAEIPGAMALKAECAQRLAGAGPADRDELVALAKKGGEVGRLATKALNTMSELAGGSTVAPPALGDMIDLQRNLEVFSRAGATNVTLPPSGRMSFPKLTNGATAYWVGEGKPITDSEQTTGALNLEAKKLAVRTPLTNELMKFSNEGIEAMVRLDQAKQAALKADLAMLQGTGGTQIKGLITYPTAASWSQGTDALIAYTVTGGLIQPEDVTAMLAALPDGVDATAWVVRPDLFVKLRNRRADGTMPGDGRGPFVFDITRSAADGEPLKPRLADVEVVRSRQVSNTRGTGAQTYALAGYFPDWLVARLGVLEFMVDPYTQMANYQTVIQVVQFVDAGPRHSASFVLADGITIA